MATFSISVRPMRLARFLMTLALGLMPVALPVMAHAQTTPPATGTAPQPAMTPSQFIQNLGDQAIAILADKKNNPDARTEKFRAMLRQSFDLPTIGRFVLGRSWMAASPEQQTEYLGLFEALVVKTYSDRFALYTGEGFRVRDARPEGDKDFIVTSEITHPDGSAATVVDWRLRQKADKLGIIDVVVEGVSMSITQRQEYTAVIQRNGGDINALLDMMRQRVQPSDPAASKVKG